MALAMPGHQFALQGTQAHFQGEGECVWFVN